MATISEWSNRQCFVWAVERPLEGRPRCSPKFTISTGQIHLQISFVGKIFSIHVYVYSEYYPSCCVTVHVEDRKRNALPLSKCTYLGGGNIIWSYPESAILKAIPDFYEDGLLIFLVAFDDPNKQYAFDVKSPTDSRSVQTEETAAEKEEISTQTSEHLNALSCLEGLSTDLSELLQNQDSQPDVVLVCGDHSVRAHKNVLCARSKVFAATLRSDLSEAKTGLIDVRDMDCEVFDPFVRYLYTGKLPELTADTARRLYEAADRYNVPRLMRRCSSFLEEGLTPDSACEVLVLADAHSDGDFKESVVDYIMKEKIPLQDDHWLPFCQSHPVLANEVLNRFFKSQIK